MKLRATIFSILLAALLFPPTPSEAFSVPLRSSPPAPAPAQSAWVAPSRYQNSHTALGLFQRTAHDKEDAAAAAAAAAAAKDSSLFRRRRRRRRSMTPTMRPAAPLTRQTLTVTTSLAINMWRRARRLVTSLAFCLCLLLNWHAVAPGGTNVAHAAKAPEQEVLVGVDTTTTTTLQQANRRSGRTIAVCAGVVLANELYKRSQPGNGNGDSSSSSLLSAPNERSDNVDQVLTRPVKALEEIKQPTAAMAAAKESSPPTPLTNFTATAEATVAMTNSSDASLAATTTAAITTNMTNIQKLQQRVETAANRMEDKLHEWSTQQTRTFQDDDAADPRKATISLMRTTAGTVTSSSGEALAARANSIKSPTGQTWTNPPTPRIVAQAPVKISPSPLAAAAAVVKPYTMPVTSAPPPPPDTMSQAIRSPAAAATATATPIVKASETSTSLSAQPAQMTGVPISTPPPPPTVPASDMTDIAPLITAVGQDGAMTTGAASDAVGSTPLSVMGFGERGSATEMAEKLIISEPRDTTTPRSSNPKYDALRPIGFENTTLGTQAKISATAPVAIEKSMVQVKSPPSATSGTHIANTPTVMTAPTIEPAMTPAARDTTPEPIRSSGIAAEEDALQQKYAAIEDVGERAYQILIDLGMI